MKDSDICSVSVEHLEGEEEMLPLVAVGDEQGLGGAIVLNIYLFKSEVSKLSLKVLKL